MEESNKEQTERTVTEKFRSYMEDGGFQKVGKDISGHSGKAMAEGSDNKGIVEKAIAGIHREGLVQGLIYSELFGLPLCKRRGR